MSNVAVTLLTALLAIPSVDPVEISDQLTESRFQDPRVAIYSAALMAGRLDLVDDLMLVCRRESLCSPIGIHERDAHLGVNWWGQARLHDRAVARGYRRPGHLNRACQEWRPEVLGRWSTHGTWGLSAGSHWQSFPECYQAEVLDITLVSAIVALEKYEKKCWAGKKRDGWCRLPSHTPELQERKRRALRNNRKRRKGDPVFERARIPMRKTWVRDWDAWWTNAWRGTSVPVVVDPLA